MKISKLLFAIFYCFLLVTIFPSVFSLTHIAGGDYISFLPVNIDYWRLFAFSIWDPKINLGWGIIPLIAYAPISTLFGILGLVTHNNVLFLERLLWWFPFFIFGIISPILLVKKICRKDSFAIFLAPLVFLFNTYILTLIAGGQIAGVGIAYAFSPIILLMYMLLIERPSLNNSLLAGIVVAAGLLLDLRMTYVILVGVVFFTLVKVLLILRNERHKIRNYPSILRSLLFIAVIPGIIAILLHAYWLIPMIIIKQNPLQELGAAYSTTSAVQFFSFAKFENSLGLLHPNWPENIFGLVHFMQPEFILLPILAFSSLFFIGKQKSKEGKGLDMYIIFFALLALVGIFLAKGANDPFGGVYLWLFSHVPGFLMFRDPTKWYLLVAVSCSVLIPYTLWNFYNWLAEKHIFGRAKVFNAQNILIAIFIFFWLFTVRQAVLRQLNGTLKVHIVPVEYKELETFLSSQVNFSRTLWIPSTQRFGYYSIEHPAVSGEDFFHTTSAIQTVKKLEEAQTEKILQDAGIKYLIVPYDSEGELFITDRKYDSKVYQSAIASISAIPWLTRVDGFGRIALFQIPSPKDHFWVTTREGEEKEATYSFISPTKYVVNLQNVHAEDTLVFTDSYSPYWVISSQGRNGSSIRYGGRFNSFVLIKSGDYSATVEYTAQKWVTIGIIVSIFSLFCIISTFLFLIKKTKKQ